MRSLFAVACFLPGRAKDISAPPTRSRIFCFPLCNLSGSSSSVGIVTDYGLEGPGSNPGGDEIFRPSRPSLGSTQPPVKWVPGLSRG